MKKTFLVVAVSSIIFITGCATNRSDTVHTRTDDAIKTVVAGKPRIIDEVVTEQAGPYLEYEKVPYRKNAVTVDLKHASFVGAIRGIAAKIGYSVSVLSGIDMSRRVTVSLQDMPTRQAIREIALAAGYVAAFDHTNRKISLGDNATYTFRLPSSVMSQLEASFSVGGNPIATSTTGGGTSGAVGGTLGGISSIKSDFTINGNYKSSKDSISRVISRVAGANAEVNIAPEIGIVTVRSNAQALARVTDFLRSLVRDSMSRVQIEASIVEVSLTDKLQYGIDWKRILQGGETTAQIITAASAPNPSAKVTVTNLNTSLVISALRQITDVSVLSQPQLMAVNHTPTTLFDGTQTPYLGSITSTVTGTAGTAQSSGQVSFATDGLSLSIRPDILSEREVMISLNPVISSIDGFSNFTLGSGNVITAPNQKIKQSFVQVLGESGKTIIIAGARYKSDSKDKSAIPGVGSTPVIGDILSGHNNRDVNRELVILLRTEIVPAPEINILVSETI